MDTYHTSVLLQQTIEALQVMPGEKFIDATLGGGGHTLEILKRDGNVLGIDQDADALEQVKRDERFKKYDLTKLTVARGNFEHIEEIATTHGFEHVSGVLFDLGISSHHVDEASRGFSFLREGPLDMRMSLDASVRAADLVNGLNKGELATLFSTYGEEPFAKRIASAIVQEREKEPFTTTTQLARLVASVYPGRMHKVHPATKVFQALRIAVNEELFVLEKALPQALTLVKSTGRIVVITFHSLEDRIVKQTYIKWEKQGLGRIITKKPLVPSKEELDTNNRSRSAKLRVFEHI